MPSEPKMAFPDSARYRDAVEVVRILHDAGHVAYFAGGCVRDALLGLESKDFDIATDAPPARVRELFRRTQAVGAAFGVILVRHTTDPLEVATFRTDGHYEDGRRPETVRFATAEEDAQRRDFTINGLFYDPIGDRVIDYVGGRRDLDHRLLRAIGDPDTRFDEDHLRLLRAVRFAARFNLAIESRTAEAITSHAARLIRISPERIAEELRMTLMPITRIGAWEMLWRFGLVGPIFRFLHDPPVRFRAAADETLIFARLSPDRAISFPLALATGVICYRLHTEAPADPASLFVKTEAQRSARALRQALKISNEESDSLRRILEDVGAMIASDPPPLAARKRFMARSTAGDSRNLMAAIEQAGLLVDRVRRINPLLAKLETENCSPPPLLTGDDLTAAGWPPGPAFKRVLEAVYDAQLEGSIDTRPQALALAQTMHQE